MSQDLAPLLEGWDFMPGKVTARIIDGMDGRAKLQLRVDLGFLQMELDGRPDGRQPLGLESFFASYLELARTAQEADQGPFLLTEDDCRKLQQEAIQYYHRYLGLFQLEDWSRVIRDTRWNLALFDFVEEHTDVERLAWMFLQYRPYALMMHVRAWAHLWLERGQLGRAQESLVEGIKEIKEFCLRQGRPELLHASEELRFLENWLAELQAAPEGSRRRRLEIALDRAISREDYESAARLRDELEGLCDDEEMASLHGRRGSSFQGSSVSPDSEEVSPTSSRDL